MRDMDAAAERSDHSNKQRRISAAVLREIFMRLFDAEQSSAGALCFYSQE